MKTILTNIILLCIGFSYAQVPPLEDHTWKLEKIVTADSTLVVPSNIYFPGTFFDTFYILGSCSDVGSQTNYNDSNMSFDAISPQLNFQICPNQQELMDIEDFFIEEFFFIDTNQLTTHEPFVYTFSTTTNKIYLDITNSEGSVATFYDNILSRQQFLEDNISIYPNPVKDILNIRCSDMSLQYISIFDLQGRILVKDDDLENNQLDLSSLPLGIYFIQIKTDHGVSKKKLVRE